MIYYNILVSNVDSIVETYMSPTLFGIKVSEHNTTKYDYFNIYFFSAGCSAVKMELVFAIDASGSVGPDNFNSTLIFLTNVVSKLQIAPDMTRVAVIRFATGASISFGLDNYDSVPNVISKISSIRYTGGGTSTYSAIDMARINIFKNARKNVPKVFVLVTDGYSNNKNLTVAAAEKLKKNTTTIFTIGVGRVNHQEMLAVASSPNCTHYYSLNSYNEIDGIISEIQRESCEGKKLFH